MHHSHPLGQHGLRLSQHCRQWAGVTVISENWRLPARAVLHEFPARPGMLLAGIVQSQGGVPQPRLAPTRPERQEFDAKALHLVDAHSGLWGFTQAVTQVQDIALSFDVTAVQALLHDNFQPRQLRGPRLGCRDELLSGLIQLLAEALRDPPDSSALYGEGLICAAFALLFARPSARPVAPLPPAQLALATDLLSLDRAQPISLRQLADRLDLPAAYLVQAFKARTGMSPYQWQWRRQLEQARAAWPAERTPLHALAGKAWSRIDAALKRQLPPSPRPWRQLRSTPRAPLSLRASRYRKPEP